MPVHLHLAGRGFVNPNVTVHGSFPKTWSFSWVVKARTLTRNQVWGFVLCVCFLNPGPDTKITQDG